MKKEIIQLSKKLISFESTHDKKNILKDIINEVEKIFIANKNLEILKFEKNGFPSIIIHPKDLNKNEIFLAGHLDVVPAKDADFIAKENGEKLFGRGSFDMKSSCAVAILSAKKIWQDNPQAPIGLIFTTDEEKGGFDGMGHIVKNSNIKPKALIIPDTLGNLNQLQTHNKGFLQIKITQIGKSAHGSKPWLGENALILLNNKLNSFLEFVDNKEKDWQTTFNPSIFNSGKQVNQVPDFAEVVFDIRIVENDSVEGVLKLLERFFPETQIDVLVNENCIVNDIENPIIKKFLQIQEKHTGRKIENTKGFGSHDGRFWSSQNIPIIATQPAGGNAHQDGEWVFIPDLELFYQILVDFWSML